MRPAQIAREIATDEALEARTECSFNEARANCAGNYEWRSFVQVNGGGLQ